MLPLCALFALYANDYKAKPAKIPIAMKSSFAIKKRGSSSISVHMMVLVLAIAGILKKRFKWIGICIECNPVIFEKLKENRRCTCIYGCISDVEGAVKFRQVENNRGFELSGIESKFDPKDIKRLDNRNAAFTIIDVPSYKLNNILEEHRLFYIDFLSLDVEGAEFDILKTIDFDRFHIRVMTIENYKKPDIRLFLESHGFRYITRVHVDDIYLNITLPKNIILPNVP